MTSPNHIAGGIVITGILSSLWNINIFANPFSIIITVFGSLLPDIDHTKSLIGKLFFPISKQIAKKYGHRTITHSLFFLFTVTIFFLFT
jgi:inner membrane protein